MTYDMMMKKSKEFFDTIDLWEWVKPNERIRIQDLMDCLEEYYASKPNLLPEEFHGFLFNFVNEYEFAQYLEKRYGWYDDEVIIEEHYTIPKKGEHNGN